MKYLLMAAILLAAACSSKKTEVAGIYKSDPSKIGIYFENYVDGSTLSLNKDNTFTRQDCAQITKGHWTASKDSLYLYCNDIRFIIDSLNYNPKYKKGTICGSKPDVFYIVNDVLKRKQENKDGSFLYDYLRKQPK
jgi:hypothetical protein